MAWEGRARRAFTVYVPLACLVFILLLINRPEVMGRHVNGRIYNAVSWFTAAGIVALTALLLFHTLRTAG